MRSKASFLAASTLCLSMALMSSDDQTSDGFILSADDFIRKQGYPKALRDEFAGLGIRVYDRDHLKYESFEFHEKIKDVDARVINAHALFNEGHCYVLPTANDAGLKDFISEMTGIAGIGNQLSVKSNPGVLAEILRAILLAHEMQHCTQPIYLVGGPFSEINSDLKAIDLLKSFDYPPDVLDEALTIYTALRLSTLFVAEGSHLTGLSVSKQRDPEDYINGDHAYQSDMRVRIYAVDEQYIFPEAMPQIERDYHTVRAFQGQGMFDDNQNLVELADLYLEAFEYLDHITGGAMIESSGYVMQERVNVKANMNVPNIDTQ